MSANANAIESLLENVWHDKGFTLEMSLIVSESLME